MEFIDPPSQLRLVFPHDPPHTLPLPSRPPSHWRSMPGLAEVCAWEAVVFALRARS